MHKIFLILLFICASTAGAQSSDEAASPRMQWGLSSGLNMYQEPGLMQLRGSELGVHTRIGGLAQVPRTHFEGDMLLGVQNYSSAQSGSQSGIMNIETRWRALVPMFGNTASDQGWFTGLAVHTLWNDLRGTTTTGYGGYRRIATQLWLPLQWRSGDVWELNAGLLVYGRHLSMLTDASSSYSDAHNTQRRGEYLQLSMNMRADNGNVLRPFIRYTHLGDSDSVFIRSPPTDDCPAGSACYAVEPNSHRWQLGVVWAFNAP